MFLSKQHNEQFNKKKTTAISLLSFSLGFIDAFIIYTLSSYFADIVGERFVGIIYLVTFGIHLFLLLTLDTVVRTVGQVRYLVLCLLFSTVAMGILPNVSSGIAGLLLAIAYLVFSNTIWVALDIILEGYSQDRLSGRIRGVHLTVMNIGLLLAPYLSMNILATFGYPAVFLSVFIGYACIVLLAVVLFRFDNRIPQRPKVHILTSLREVMRVPDLVHIFFVSFALEFFYAIMIVYTAIHLQAIGFGWEEIGLLFTIMLLPFVLLQYPVGILADRRFGEKEMLALSFILTITATMGMVIYHGKQFFVWAGILFFTRIGIAAIEVLRDSYFYKQIDGNDTHIIAFFRMARPVGNISAALISVLLLAFFPLTSVFCAVVVVLFLALFHIFTLTDTESEFDVARKESRYTSRPLEV